jgi:hypothetical protein
MVDTDEFEIGMTVVCIKEYNTIKIGKHCPIKGGGDLTWIHGTDKEGYGFSVEDDGPCYDNYKLPPNEIKKSIIYYFTLEEMSEYFISESRDYRIYLRDEKIKEILK